MNYVIFPNQTSRLDVEFQILGGWKARSSQSKAKSTASPHPTTGKFFLHVWSNFVRIKNNLFYRTISALFTFKVIVL